MHAPGLEGSPALRSLPGARARWGAPQTGANQLEEAAGGRLRAMWMQKTEALVSQDSLCHVLLCDLQQGTEPCRVSVAHLGNGDADTGSDFLARGLHL